MCKLNFSNNSKNSLFLNQKRRKNKKKKLSFIQNFLQNFNKKKLKSHVKPYLSLNLKTKQFHTESTTLFKSIVKKN